jgi:hypothetical protein
MPSRFGFVRQCGFPPRRRDILSNLQPSQRESSKRSVRRTLSEQVLFQLGRESEPGSSGSPARLVMAVYAEEVLFSASPQTCRTAEEMVQHGVHVNVDNRRCAVHRVAAAGQTICFLLFFFFFVVDRTLFMRTHCPSDRLTSTKGWVGSLLLAVAWDCVPLYL